MTDLSPPTHTPSRWATWASTTLLRMLTEAATALLALERIITRPRR